ncbi:hypothetical protein ILUMI_15578 [Ignelater luminosus]|uniref:Uncharacterized protein n=1 Tax=Ignelater luminosus TaxID=2038154 RepID=A0A8K0G3R1_IGNLU|nr:hypothetical protein ILUMI_15578 [Ignelater luminosus]
MEISKGQSPHTQTNMRTVKVYTALESPLCVNCKQQHVIQNCKSFLKLDVQSQNKKAQELKVCLNCLRGGHFLSNCNSRSTCKKFHRRHHTLIHLEANKANETIPMNIPQVLNENTMTNTSNQTNSTTNLSSSTLNSQTLLSTAMVKVNDTEYNSHQIRVLLDSASQSNFVSEGLWDELKLEKTPIAMNVIGIEQGTIIIPHKGSSSKWKTYIANRVTEIQRLSDPNDWFYVKSADNAADLISRGLSPEELAH